MELNLGFALEVGFEFEKRRDLQRWISWWNEERK